MYFWEYLKGEKEVELETLDNNKDEFELCVSAWNFLEGELVKSIGNKSSLLLMFKQQVDKGLFLAIVSLMRMHSAQTMANLRFAHENMAICFYFMHFPEESNNLFQDDVVKNFDIPRDLKIKGFKLMEEKYPELNKDLKWLSDLTNHHGAHANFFSAVLNSSVNAQKVVMEKNVFDNIYPFLLKSLIFCITDVILLFATLFIKFRKYDEMMPLIEGSTEKLENLKHKLKIMRKEKEEREKKWQKDAQDGHDCWCGSGKNFDHCHKILGNT